MARACQAWYSIMTSFASKCVARWHFEISAKYNNIFSSIIRFAIYDVINDFACLIISMKYMLISNYHWLQTPTFLVLM